MPRVMLGLLAVASVLCATIVPLSPARADGESQFERVDESDDGSGGDGFSYRFRGIRRIGGGEVVGECESSCDPVVVQWEYVVATVDRDPPNGDFCTTVWWYTSDYLNQSPVERGLFNEAVDFTDQYQATNGPAPPCADLIRIDPRDLPLVDTAAQYVTPPAPDTSPNTEGLTGLRTYVTGDIPTTASGPLVFTLPPVAGFSSQTINGTFSATLEHYYVDWEWDGTSSIDQAAADDETRSVTGPHAPGSNTGPDTDTDAWWVYQETTLARIAVQPVWTITASAGGYTITDTDVPTGIRSRLLQVNQAQPVRLR